MFHLFNFFSFGAHSVLFVLNYFVVAFILFQFNLVKMMQLACMFIALVDDRTVRCRMNEKGKRLKSVLGNAENCFSHLWLMGDVELPMYHFTNKIRKIL